MDGPQQILRPEERSLPPYQSRDPIDQWIRLAAFWRVNIGPLEEFWSLSPRETDAVLEAFFDREDVVNQRFGTVAATVWNAQRSNKKAKVLTWKDFFTPLSKKATVKRGLSHEEMMLKAMESRFQFYGRTNK